MRAFLRGFAFSLRGVACCWALWVSLLISRHVLKFPWEPGDGGSVFEEAAQTTVRGLHGYNEGTEGPAHEAGTAAYFTLLVLVLSATPSFLVWRVAAELDHWAAPPSATMNP